MCTPLVLRMDSVSKESSLADFMLFDFLLFELLLFDLVVSLRE